MEMEQSWLSVLEEEFTKSYMKDLEKFLSNEIISGKKIYPPTELVFNAFCQTSFDEVKVVIVGQDPYHGPLQAHGLSFSVLPGVVSPPSLQNIFKELRQDAGIKMPKEGCLLPWAKQGVLLLNATLTVEEHAPRSHYGRGWEEFTDAVIEKIAQREKPVVFLLWGKSAQEKCQKILDKEGCSHHLILRASHPSPYSANGFFGCRHFSKTNEFLVRKGDKPIDWQVE